MNRQPAKRIEPKPAINRYETTPKPARQIEPKTSSLKSSLIKPKSNRTDHDLEIADEQGMMDQPRQTKFPASRVGISPLSFPLSNSYAMSDKKPVMSRNAA